MDATNEHQPRWLRLHQIIGQRGLSASQARENKRRNRAAKAKGKGKALRLPVRPRPEITALIPVSKSTWWEGIRAARFPAPEYPFGAGTPFWNYEKLRPLLEARPEPKLAETRHAELQPAAA